MSIKVKGFFKIDTKKNYVVLDSVGNEIGTLDVIAEPMRVCMNNKQELEFKTEDDLEQWFLDNDYMLTADSIRWVEYNPNPEGKNVNDCSIRAYCAAENIDWNEAYDIACKYGKGNAMMPNDNKACHKILTEEFGYEFHKFKKDEKGKTVREIAINYPKGTYVLNCPGHLVTIIDGEYYDSWDSGKKKVSGIYYKPDVK